MARETTHIGFRLEHRRKWRLGGALRQWHAHRAAIEAEAKESRKRARQRKRKAELEKMRQRQQREHEPERGIAHGGTWVQVRQALASRLGAPSLKIGEGGLQVPLRADVVAAFGPAIWPRGGRTRGREAPAHRADHTCENQPPRVP
mgnify:CR=1 FL=1